MMEIHLICIFFLATFQKFADRNTASVFVSVHVMVSVTCERSHNYHFEDVYQSQRFFHCAVLGTLPYLVLDFPKKVIKRG